jgi:hypothetical protein
MPFYGISENGANIQLDQYGYSSIAGKRLPSEGQRHVARHQCKKMVKPAGKRETVVHLCEAHGVSDPLPRQAIAEQSAERGRACDVLQIDRSTVLYLSRRGDDVELRDPIKRVSRERRRFGYSRRNSNTGLTISCRFFDRPPPGTIMWTWALSWFASKPLPGNRWCVSADPHV